MLFLKLLRSLVSTHLLFLFITLLTTSEARSANLELNCPRNYLLGWISFSNLIFWKNAQSVLLIRCTKLLEHSSLPWHSYSDDPLLHHSDDSNIHRSIDRFNLLFCQSHWTIHECHHKFLPLAFSSSQREHIPTGRCKMRELAVETPVQISHVVCVCWSRRGTDSRRFYRVRLHQTLFQATESKTSTTDVTHV